MALASSLKSLPAVSGSTPLGRPVDYMRISVTDRCNERCLYCMPEQFSDWGAKENILTYGEILAIVGVAIERGFKHFRVTGGEPLIRPDIVSFIRDLIQTPGVETVQLSTNGTRLPELAEPLFAAGLRSLNISLDALAPHRYRAITGGDVTPVLEGIQRAQEVGFPSIKLNTVLIRHQNEGDIWPLVQFASEKKLPIRFIELMPVSLTEMLTEKNFLPVSEVQAMLNQRDRLIPMEKKLGHGPAAYFRMARTGATVGFIGALTNLHFCEACNKVRLTADGHLRPCLGQHGEYDLKPALRPKIDRKGLLTRINQALAEKPPEHAFRNNWQPQRIMTAIGG